ncbi:MAG: PHP domain-containing protein [Butyrivibrio sp.]|nr:PHP domain-containing protein [Butyrivibrio sp.]
MENIKIDLHMHSTVSDGTDTPAEILEKVKKEGIGLFSITDHDAIKAAELIPPLLKADSPRFISGTEISCRDEDGKYHILGYGYRSDGKAINDLVEKTHSLRLYKVNQRLEFLKDSFGFTFSKEDIDDLLSNYNPGKPHIGKLMVKYGYVNSKEEAIENYLNKKKFANCYVRPKEAIEAILDSGGIPVLAHPIYGDGGQLIQGEEMRKRLDKLTSFGIKGVEAYYSGFSFKMINEMLDFSKKYDLYVTAGSDYHGSNKLVILGDNNLEPDMEYPENLLKFVEDVHKYEGK